MSLDRRDLLRRFGIGAIIAPVIGGQPLMSEPVRLIEPAKVEAMESLIHTPRFSVNDLARLRALFEGSANQVLLAFKARNGTIDAFTGHNAFVRELTFSLDRQIVDVTSVGELWPHEMVFSAYDSLRWEARGVALLNGGVSPL